MNDDLAQIELDLKALRQKVKNAQDLIAQSRGELCNTRMRAKTSGMKAILVGFDGILMEIDEALK